MTHSNLLLDFVADKSNNTLTIRREFAAERPLVWDCYTKAELLNQWFAPKPFTTKTKSMDFSNGGHWHYAMVDPNGSEYWGWTEYKNIKPIDSYETLDAFSNEAGEINTDLPRAKWEVTFTDKGNHAVVQTIVYYASLTDLETIINMGMQEGMIATFEKLDELLWTLNNSLLFEFNVDKTAKTVFINKEFAAELPLVWDTFTKQELLDQWWAPKPFVSKTKSMDFKVGGKRLYAMISPEGHEMWAIHQYTSITPKTNFKYLNAFADKDGNPFLPGSDWDLTFIEQNEKTKVSITIYNDSLERMEKMMEMGFKEGFTATLNELGELLNRMKN